MHSSGANAFNPQYTCSSLDYAYTVAKGDLTYPVGLLTADEFSYAGGVIGSSNPNTSYYLYTGEMYWTMSPFGFSGSDAYVWGVASTGCLGHGYVNGTTAVVPVISLKRSAKVEKGTGAYNDPYVIKTN